MVDVGPVSPEMHLCCGAYPYHQPACQAIAALTLDDREWLEQHGWAPPPPVGADERHLAGLRNSAILAADQPVDLMDLPRNPSLSGPAS